MDRITEYITEYIHLKQFILRGIEFLKAFETISNDPIEIMEIIEVRLELLLRLHMLEESVEDDLVRISTP